MRPVTLLALALVVGSLVHPIGVWATLLARPGKVTGRSEGEMAGGSGEARPQELSSRRS